MQLVALLFGLFTARANDIPDGFAGPFSGGKNPAETIQEDMKEKKTAEELALEQRLQEIEDAQRAKVARVIVLQWRDTDTDYSSEPLQRNIKARIARPDAKFYPEIDLYQAGRKEPDNSIRAVDQRAVVSDQAVATVLSAVEEVAPIPWNAMSEQDWGIKAQELYDLQDEIWFVDRPELREARFLLYAQIGRAAESANQGSPPFYQQIGGQTVNYFWYLAGSMAYQSPELMAKIDEQNLNASIMFYKDSLDAGGFPPMTLDFSLDNGKFDPKSFTNDYTVWINGLEQTIKNPNGLLDVPPGKVDVYMKRNDGHSLSDRVDIFTMQEKFYFVRQNARKRMGLDFIDQLMAHPFECTPDIAGDILNYLSIYAKLHPQAEIYIAVPKAGSTAPGRLYLWRWDRAKGVLVRVQDNTGGFPVRFAALLGAGLTFFGADAQTPSDEKLAELAQSQQPGATPDFGSPGDYLDITPRVEGLPVYYHLRGHYNHFMMGLGIEYKFGFGAGAATDDKPFVDMFQTTNGFLNPEGHADAITYATVPCTNENGQIADNPTCLGNPGGDYSAPILALRERAWQRLVFASMGMMLGRDSASGWGPRGYLRFGWYNAPHAADTTIHLGYTGHVGGKSKEDQRKEEARMDRVRMILDADFFGGMLLPFMDSLYVDATRRGTFMAIGPPIPTMGFTVGAGLTF
ncbi:MAG: hypothetical protein H6738_20475 [Alphaproteobacteria bacterium]|nr:hypothetical protein [Alphaproteobacteria bacterium]MCB9699167.1 hypothetical protein [Alphaproteobacteria bacterium]